MKKPDHRTVPSNPLTSQDPPDRKTTTYSRALSTALHGGTLEDDGSTSGQLLGKRNHNPPNRGPGTTVNLHGHAGAPKPEDLANNPELQKLNQAAHELRQKQTQHQKLTLRPQPGPQTTFLASQADVAIMGGGAGGTKSFSLMLEATRHLHVPNFFPVIFRREYPQITNPGALWDDSFKIFPIKAGNPHKTDLTWSFPKHTKVKFAHMQREEDRFNWDGSQITYIAFDQLESFTWVQWAYMFSRNRSTCGVRPYMRASCNPDPDHFLRDLLRWWIDDQSGYAIKERSGTIRWFVMKGNEVVWADHPDELTRLFGPSTRPKSFTFIPSTVYDNPILLEANPDYLANLEALLPVERARLLQGNWNIRESAGDFFRRSWILNGGGIIEGPPKLKRVLRYWDRAATAMKNGQPVKGASASAGCKMGETANGSWILLDMRTFQKGPIEVDQEILDIGLEDGPDVEIVLEQDPAQAGLKEAQALARTLGHAGLSVRLNPVREDKGQRFKPFARQCAAGNVAAVRGPYLEPLFRALENFDGSSKKSDEADACSGAFLMLGGGSLRAGTW